MSTRSRIEQSGSRGRSGVSRDTSQSLGWGGLRRRGAGATVRKSMPLKGKLQALCSAVFLVLAVPLAPPAQAATWDAVFYELTENMTFDGATRTGSGALAGEAMV